MKAAATIALLLLLATPAPAQDLDHDGWVGFADFLLFAQAYGQETPATRLEGVWVSRRVVIDGEDVTELSTVFMSFVGGRFSLTIDSQLGPSWAQAGRYAAYGDQVVLRWGDGQRQTMAFKRQHSDLELTTGGFVFTMKLADVWASEQESSEEGRR